MLDKTFCSNLKTFFYFSISIQVKNLPSKEMTKMNRELGKNSRENHFTRTFLKLRNVIKYDGN